MSPKETPIPRIGTSGTSGVLNGRGRSGRFIRSAETPAHAMTNAWLTPLVYSFIKSFQFDVEVVLL